ncbi:SurA N-terminal domain-containing protein [Candidatus Leptofilum sp.]|uniref:SurA N-terminal domain-containing protein n=1 Tax=Candidatus Leptofilum sp. TaxID=3241576 RepID=UPI003B599569
MAKKQETQTTSEQRQTRKEVLLARKQAQQTRRIRIGVGIVGGLLLLIFLAAVVNELLIAPNRAVAIVNEEEISLGDWQDRVRFERAQRIILLENQLAAFQDNVGFVQQFAGQTINELLQTEQLGQAVLNQMIDEVVIRQAAEARGITVTDEEVQNNIEATFSFYDGGLPTPLPTATATVEPTPSITPLPTAVITDVVPTAMPTPTASPPPTNTPAPTATPVSAEAFQQEFSDFMTQFAEKGVSEELYREIVRTQLYRERLVEALAEENELSDEAEQASFFVLQFGTEEEANEAEALIAEQGYLPVWNEIRSIVPDPESGSTASTDEVVWLTQTATANRLGAEVAEAAFTLPIREPSSVISRTVDAQTTLYYLIQLTGKEERPLSATEYQTLQQENLGAFIQEQLVTGGLTLTEYDRGRTPTNPVLDPIFTTPPTATPALPTGG